MRVTFPHWPVWNYQFPQKDVVRVVDVNYFDDANKPQSLPREFYRLAIGRSGVSALVLFRKGELPKVAKRPDAVAVEYEA